MRPGVGSTWRSLEAHVAQASGGCRVRIIPEVTWENCCGVTGAMNILLRPCWLLTGEKKKCGCIFLCCNILPVLSVWEENTILAQGGHQGSARRCRPTVPAHSAWVMAEESAGISQALWAFCLLLPGLPWAQLEPVQGQQIGLLHGQHVWSSVTPGKLWCVAVNINYSCSKDMFAVYTGIYSWCGLWYCVWDLAWFPQD